jgi:WD40 repeat protein
VATGKPTAPPLLHSGGVTAASFSPDGTRVVTASSDRTARVWDAATGKAITLPLVHQEYVLAAAFSPDGTRVVTASYDKTARVWDVRLDNGTIEQWSAATERSPFVLMGVALMRRAARPMSRPTCDACEN